MAKVAQPRGKSIAKVGHLNIYQKNKQEMKDVEGKKTERTAKTEISIFHGKKMVEGETGFKNKTTAVLRANELIKAHLDKKKETK
ncbi:MAG TPA: hypothetical protein VN922_23880 [Bacteroidia bacterium]|jgi:hypothetical protein|nr:hypothetical protein [Bacteroidia bacterium]